MLLLRETGHCLCLSNETVAWGNFNQGMQHLFYENPLVIYDQLVEQGGGGLVAKSCLTLVMPWPVAC